MCSVNALLEVLRRAPVVASRARDHSQAAERVVPAPTEGWIGSSSLEEQPTFLQVIHSCFRVATQPGGQANLGKAARELQIVTRLTPHRGRLGKPGGCRLIIALPQRTDADGCNGAGAFITGQVIRIKRRAWAISRLLIG